jgi:hypothetical protein
MQTFLMTRDFFIKVQTYKQFKVFFNHLMEVLCYTEN